MEKAILYSTLFVHKLCNLNPFENALKKIISKGHQYLASLLDSYSLELTE